MIFLTVSLAVLKNANIANRNIIGFHPIIIDVINIFIVLEIVVITFNDGNIWKPNKLAPNILRCNVAIIWENEKERIEDKPIEEAKAKVKEEEAVSSEQEAGSGEQEDAVEEKEEASETPEPEMDPQEAAKLAQQTFIVQSTYKDMRKDLPDFRSGDTVSVGYRVIEGSRSRIQSFEGVVIKISAGHGLDKTFTVRKISSGVGVERIFPLHSPNIDSIKVLKQGKVRRAKLYYLRSRVGKATRIKERTSQ